jgi:hypothetical protein
LVQEHWVFIVDDRLDEPAAELRDQFFQEFVETEGDSSRYCAPRDPAAWFPVHRDAVVAYPSAPDGERFVGHSAFEALSLRSNRMTDGNLGDWARAVASTVESPPSGEQGEFAFLSTLATAVDVLRGLEPPATPDEESFAASASESDAVVVLVLVTAHEDSSEGPAEDYALLLSEPFEGVFASDIVLPAAVETPCDEVRSTTPRLATWTAVSKPFSYETWSPGDDCELRGPGLQCGIGRCLDFSPRFASDGQARCKLYVESADDSPCPENIGWLPVDPADPDAQPQFDSDNRVCEVRQLGSAALASCRSELECNECEPGFCFTEVESLQGDCQQNGQVPLPRLVHGADRGATGRFRLICER